MCGGSNVPPKRPMCSRMERVYLAEPHPCAANQTQALWQRTIRKGTPLLDGILETYERSSMTMQSRDMRRIMLAILALHNGEYTADMLEDLTKSKDELGDLARSLDVMARQAQFRDRQLQMLRTVIPIGVSLSAEKDFNRLLETVVVEAQDITNADAGTLYLVDGRILRFMIVRNESLNLAIGGTTGNEITFKPIPLYKEDSGQENRSNIASYVALTHSRVILPDAYEAEGFDFSGTREFDKRTGYRSKSFLAVPLENSEKHVIGVIQLINARDPETGEIIPFGSDDVLETLILMASVALDGYIREQRLRQEIAKLRIEIDETRRAKQVNEITNTAYFQELKSKVDTFRAKKPDIHKDK